MSAHSPGPWRLVIGEQCSSEEPSYAILDANGDTVCDNERFYPQAVSPENQTLIVVAPELLMAVERLNDCLVKCLTGGEVSAKLAGRAISDAATLIAKARGEQPCS